VLLKIYWIKLFPRGWERNKNVCDGYLISNNKNGGWDHKSFECPEVYDDSRDHFFESHLAFGRVKKY
jgi:hypothetical protein